MAAALGLGGVRRPSASVAFRLPAVKQFPRSMPDNSPITGKQPALGLVGSARAIGFERGAGKGWFVGTRRHKLLGDRYFGRRCF